jgi:hypothetical protein
MRNLTLLASLSAQPSLEKKYLLDYLSVKLPEILCSKKQQGTGIERQYLSLVFRI